MWTRESPVVQCLGVHALTPSFYALWISVISFAIREDIYMYVCIYTCVYVRLCIYVYVYVRIHIFYLYIYTHNKMWFSEKNPWIC